MEISKGIRAKLFFLFMIMGSIPFILIAIIGGFNTVSELEESGKQSSLLRNTIISEHVTDLIEKNQAVLHVVALTPEVIDYVQSPTDEKRERVRNILNATNAIFDDTNLMAITGGDGWQLIRTDESTLVNLSKRQHFREAMKGRNYVSDILTSMSTGKMIIVMEVPIRNAEGKPIGMLQRNFDLSALQDFVQNYGDNETSIVVMDRTGRIIANSDHIQSLGNEYAIDDSYEFILDRIYNSSGVINVDVNGEEAVATYSQNIETGWMIVTIRPYHFILDQARDKAVKAIVFGMVILFIGTLVAYLLTIRVTKPIIEITNAVDEIVSGKTPSGELRVSTDDEFGQVAAAVNKLRSERDAYQLESELDRLTELFNKKTMENLCRMKLKTFNENNNQNIFMALYVIDLDHFKEVNDLMGHQFGDKVLIEFAKGLRKIFRPNDCIGRFGGDEFVVIVDSLPNMEVVIRKAEQIKQIAFNLTVEGKGHIVTASIGVAIAPQNGRDYDTLFSSADKAVYHVKNNGKNGYYCELFENDDDDDN